MFGKFDKNKIEENNSRVEESSPDSSQEEAQGTGSSDMARDIIGHGLGIIGQMAGIVGVVGGSMYILTSLVGSLGFSVLMTIVGLLGLAVVCQLIANYTIVHDFDEIRGAYNV